MPKLRNSTTDVGTFAQWIGRKVRNHQPLQELSLDKSARAKKPGNYGCRRHSTRVGIVSDCTLICTEGSRSFVVVVSEVDAEHAASLRALAKPVGL